ncbi:unnamed protein product [Angiostrongylus costaricensis]|uniref:Ubiquitin-like domain-containing protein n=1 Tax=Angiostrongylus costaricensis TaxID=334426 RepID=A0A0R3PUB5_ANGCS|nr:unnamed protein product [Angiostrongylus costaricensis]
MKMKIRVKIMDQTDHHFEVDDQMLLSDFRIEVADRLHIPPERQRMIFAVSSPMNGRERITYVIPFERSGILAENAHIEEMIQSALDGLTFLTNDQRRRITTHWESNNIHISLPSQRTPHVASPSLERVALIETLLEHIAHFYQIVEMPGGIADRIDEFLDGSHTYDEESTTVFNEQLRADALSLEREPLIRSRLVDRLNTEEEAIDESDELAARFQRVEETSGSPGYVMRHAITYDLVYILRRLHDEYERIRPHMVRLERILNSRILYNIDDAEHTDTDYRANFFTVYMEHIQRAFHRLSHVWHLTSDLGSDVQELTGEEIRIIGLNPTAVDELLFALIKQSDAIIAPRLRPRQSRENQLPVAEDSSAEVPTLSASNNSPSLEEVLIRTVEQSLPSLESSNPYERFMRLLLQRASDPSFDMNSLFRNTAIQQAFNHDGTQAERTSTTGHLYQQSSSSPSQMPNQQSLVPSLGSLARGVITQTGNQMPFMSEVISNIMRNNGINGAMSPQVDVILEYGEGGSQSSINHIQPQLIDLSAGGISEQRGHPTAIGYHVEVHQFDVIPQSMGPDSSQISSQHSISLNTYAPSTSSNYSNLPNTTGSTSARGGFVPGGQRQLGPANNLPLFMGNTGFQPEMHVTPPRQEVGLNSSGDILVNDEENFRAFIQLAVRSALSQMVHADQDRNAQNARGFAPHVFSVGQSVQVQVTPGGGEVVETMSAPILVHAEVQQHSAVNAVSTSAPEYSQNIPSITSNSASNEQRIDSFLREDGSRNILTEMANAMTLGFESRLITILDMSGAPTSLLRPGNALLLNFATLGDLASMLDFNMTPLEFHRAHFRAHVIENQLNGNSTPTDDDLLSASERLAALHSSIASIICTAGGEVERIWNVSDAEFSRRIQNTLRDYVRHLVALGNYSFSNSEQTAYITIVFELLVNADRSIGNADTNLTRLMHLRRFVLPRIVVLLRGQGPLPNLDEIPSRLLAWTDCLRPDVSSISDVHSPEDEHQVCNAVHNGVNEDYHDSHDETRSRGTPSIGPAAAKKRKLEDEELKPSTSHACFGMSTATRTGTGSEEDAQSAAQLRGYDGDWARFFPDWVETIECDALSGQTNPRLLRNPSDMYQMGHLEHGRRQVVPEHASEESLLSSAAQEIVGNVFRGNIPTTIHENISSGAALSALDELMVLAIQHRILGDSDYDSSQYPNVARQFHKNHGLL